MTLKEIYNQCTEEEKGYEVCIKEGKEETMKKNKLIEKLQKIEGNPDIVIWNGHVIDYMDIGSFLETTLVKESFDFKKEYINNDRKERNKPELSEVELDDLKTKIRKSSWEIPNEFVSFHEYPKWYGKNIKRVIFICPKLRNKKINDRNGKIYY